jgi:hypothetical protein
MLNITRKFFKLNSRILCSKFTPIRNFRDYRDDTLHYKANETNKMTERSPYQPQFELSEEERIENDKLPVEQRILDWRKYMKHKGKLKYSSGTFLVDVEPFPRLKIMMLCDIAMNLLKKIPDSFDYKHLSYNFIKYVMQVVDENESIIDIENKISDVSSAESIIMVLHNEVTLLQNIVQENWSEIIEKEKKQCDYKDLFTSAAIMDWLNVGVNATDSTAHKKNERPERPASANYSEKNKEAPKH